MKAITTFIKTRWKYIIVAIVALFIGASFGPSSEEYEFQASKARALMDKVEVAEAKNKELSTKSEELQAKVDEAAPFFKMAEEERKAKEAEAKAKAEELKKKEEAEKAKKEAAEKAEAEKERKAEEEKERKGYDTGITYNQLARTPDDYTGEKVKFRGTVIQVMEGDDTTQIRLAVNDDYDTVLFAEYDSSITESRVLDEDTITIMGTSGGLITYDSTMGGEISIPGIAVDKIEQ